MYLRFANALFEPTLEPRARRVDPDHDGGGLRSRGSRRVSTTRSARCATSCRTTSCRSSLWLRWSLPPGTSDAIPRRRESTSFARCRRSIRRLPCAVSTSATRDIEGVAARLGHRDIRRAALRDRELALGGRPDPRARREVAARTATEIVVRLQRVPQLRWGTHVSTPRATTTSSCGSDARRACRSSCERRRPARRSRSRSRSTSISPKSSASRPARTSACLPTCFAGTARSSRAGR